MADKLIISLSVSQHPELFDKQDANYKSTMLKIDHVVNCRWSLQPIAAVPSPAATCQNFFGNLIFLSQIGVKFSENIAHQSI